MKFNKLADIAEIIMGQSPKGSSYNKKNLGLPLLNGAADYKGSSFNPNQYTTNPLKVAKKGDIILGIRATIGNFSIVDRDYCIGRGVAGIRPNEKIIDKSYLIRNVEKELNKIIHRAEGSTIKGIKKEDLSEIKIPCPPLETQQKIASILDKAQALCELDKQIINKYDQLAQSVFLEMFGDSLVNPKGWRKETLEKVTLYITDGKHGDCNDQQGSGYFFISAKDINNGIIDYSNARQIVKKDFEEVHKRTDLKIGDILLVNTGATIGKTAIAVDSEKTYKTTFQKSVAVIKPKTNILNSYFLKFLFSFQINIIAKSSSGSAVQNLLLSQIRKFQIIVPPFELQDDFEKKIRIIEYQKNLAQQSLKKSEELFQCLLQKAFKGELIK